VPGDPPAQLLVWRVHKRPADQPVQLLAPRPARRQQHGRHSQLAELLGRLRQERACPAEWDRQDDTQVALAQPVPDGQAQHLDVRIMKAAQHLAHDQHVAAAVLGVEV
jgi:hypothetical protein